PAVMHLAIEVTRGTSNNLFQVATLIRAATTIDAYVDVLFRGAALRKLARDRIDEDEWSMAYAAIHDALAERLASAEFTDMATFLHDAKEHGDHVHLWASAEELAAADLRIEDLVPSVDGARSSAGFGELARQANARLV